MTFDFIVSLGSDCTTRYQIERIQKQRDPSFIPETFYFDWLWRDKGFQSNIIALQDKLNFSKKDFRLKFHDSSYQVYNVRSGFYFLHDFNLTDNSINSNIEDLQDQFNEQYGNFESKYNYLADKTRQLMSSGNKVLYVFAKQQISLEECARFFDFIGINSYLLHLPDLELQMSGPYHKRLFSFSIIHNSPDWMGNDEQWDLAFSEIPKIKIPAQCCAGKRVAPNYKK